MTKGREEEIRSESDQARPVFIPRDEDCQEIK